MPPARVRLRQCRGELRSLHRAPQDHGRSASSPPPGLTLREKRVKWHHALVQRQRPLKQERQDGRLAGRQARCVAQGPQILQSLPSSRSCLLFQAPVCLQAQVLDHPCAAQQPQEHGQCARCCRHARNVNFSKIKDFGAINQSRPAFSQSSQHTRRRLPAAHFASVRSAISLACDGS